MAASAASPEKKEKSKDLGKEGDKEEGEEAKKEEVVAEN